MDEKTSELRDIFLDVTDEETVTESQEELRGSVAASGTSDPERLNAAIDEMQEKFDFETDLDTGTLEHLLELYYDDCTDDEIASALSVSSEAVFTARMDLHLVRDDDPPGVSATDEEWDVIRTQIDDPVEAVATELDRETEQIESVRAVIRANSRTRRVSNRFRITFEECLTDADLSTQLAAEAHRDGLADATEDAEVDVDF